jgi:tryptophanyl-tRNA synthetase
MPAGENTRVSTPRVFSGIQPSGSLTIGNYLGAIRNWVRDQDRYHNIFCVVDLHAITVPQDPADLRQRTWETAAILLASGIDPVRSILFAQSHVTEHTTLSWLLNTITPMGWLNRMTQFKAKAGSERESVGTGLFDYPVLMAADILAYNADGVPVGEVQKQHVELTRDIAERFNSLYGDTFVVPKPLIPSVGARVMSLDDPTRKMSKSEPVGAIFMLDEASTIKKKVSRAQTDSLATVRFSEEQPGLLNLLGMIRALTGESEAEIEQRFAGGGYKPVKDEVTERLVNALRPIHERYDEFMANPDEVDCILAAGADRAREIAGPVVANAQHRMGLRRPS